MLWEAVAVDYPSVINWLTLLSAIGALGCHRAACRRCHTSRSPDVEYERPTLIYSFGTYSMGRADQIRHQRCLGRRLQRIRLRIRWAGPKRLVGIGRTHSALVPLRTRARGGVVQDSSRATAASTVSICKSLRLGWLPWACRVKPRGPSCSGVAADRHRLPNWAKSVRHQDGARALWRPRT